MILLNGEIRIWLEVCPSISKMSSYCFVEYIFFDLQAKYRFTDHTVPTYCCTSNRRSREQLSQWSNQVINFIPLIERLTISSTCKLCDGFLAQTVWWDVRSNSAANPRSILSRGCSFKFPLTHVRKTKSSRCTVPMLIKLKQLILYFDRTHSLSDDSAR